MEALYAQLSKEQLIARLIAAEREKEQLSELVFLRDMTIKELTRLIE